MRKYRKVLYWTVFMKIAVSVYHTIVSAGAGAESVTLLCIYIHLGYLFYKIQAVYCPRPSSDLSKLHCEELKG